MHTIIVTASEMQKDFMQYIDELQSGKVIIVTQGGKEIGRFMPTDVVNSTLTDSLMGILAKETFLCDAKERNTIVCD